MLNVGLVGFGFAGKVFHAPVIRAVDGLRLSVIVQRHGPPDPRYPDVEFVRSLDDLLSRKSCSSACAWETVGTSPTWRDYLRSSSKGLR